MVILPGGGGSNTPTCFKLQEPVIKEKKQKQNMVCIFRLDILFLDSSK